MLTPFPTITMRQALPFRAITLLAALFALGCNNSQVIEYERKIAELERTVDAKNTRLVEQKSSIDELNRQLDAARGVPDDWAEKIILPERLVIAALSGGANYDDKPGDDGVTVYLRPVDRDGDALKVAGDIRIELYDLANPPGRNLIGRYKVSADEARGLWYGAMMTSHYTVKCPWKNGPPAHPEITIRATFIDFLMKRVMTAQSVCTVELPPSP